MMMSDITWFDLGNDLFYLDTGSRLHNLILVPQLVAKDGGAEDVDHLFWIAPIFATERPYITDTTTIIVLLVLIFALMCCPSCCWCCFGCYRSCSGNKHQFPVATHKKAPHVSKEVSEEERPLVGIEEPLADHGLMDKLKSIFTERRSRYMGVIFTGVSIALPSIFVPSFYAAFITNGPLFPPSTGMKFLLVLPILGTILMPLCVVLAGIIWMTRRLHVAERIFFSVIAVATVLLVPWYVSLGFLGYQY
jgi:hypothetical protein